MTTMLLNLVSDQIIPVILGAMRYQPSHMVFVRSDLAKYEHNIQRICAFLKQRFDFTYEERIVDAYDFEDVLKKMRAISPASLSVYCNITGGTKLMAIAAFQAMSEKGIPSFYIDTDNDRLITIQGGEIHSEPIIPRLTVDDFVRITGAVISREQTSWFHSDSRLAILSDIIHRHQTAWQRTNDYLKAVQDKFPSESLLVKAPVNFFDRNKTLIHPELHIMRELGHIGLIEELRLSNDEIVFRYADQMSKRMLLNHGLWLEYYVYKTILRLQENGILQIDDVRAGVELNWDSNGANKNVVNNELDIMVTRSSKLFCISCKAGAKIKDISKVLNEIEQYSRRLGGIFYYPALVLTTNPDSKLAKRAEITRVKLFQLSERFPDELSAWLQQ